MTKIQHLTWPPAQHITAEAAFSIRPAPLESGKAPYYNFTCCSIYTKYAHNSRKLHMNAHLVLSTNHCEDCSRAAVRTLRDPESLVLLKPLQNDSEIFYTSKTSLLLEYGSCDVCLARTRPGCNPVAKSGDIEDGSAIRNAKPFRVEHHKQYYPCTQQHPLTHPPFPFHPTAYLYILSVAVQQKLMRPCPCPFQPPRPTPHPPKGIASRWQWETYDVEVFWRELGPSPSSGELED